MDELICDECGREVPFVSWDGHCEDCAETCMLCGDDFMVEPNGLCASCNDDEEESDEPED